MWHIRDVKIREWSMTIFVLNGTVNKFVQLSIHQTNVPTLVSYLSLQIRCESVRYIPIEWNPEPILTLYYSGAASGGGTRGTSPPPEIEKIVVEN